ncbi:MAG: type II secretion system F family protein [Candidatus Sungbacteria bacterium]|nr:type II secretion system F family protein [Candidatus Sungbacteria bacterium]
MTIFNYSAAGEKGAISRGSREAENQAALARMLKQEGLFLLNAEEKDAQKKTARGFARFNVNLDAIGAKIIPVSLTEKMFFSRNLAVMIKAGLSLTRTLEALAEESTNARMKKILHAVNEEVTKGTSFADALRVHEKTFGTLFVNMVEVGELTGKLTLVLKLLANQMRKDSDLRKRVKGAMIFPAVIVIVLIGIGALMMVYVVPSLAATIKDLGGELPLSTKIVITASNLVLNYSLPTFGVLILLIFAFWRVLKTNTGRNIFDRVFLKFPIFGTLIKKFNTARFCRTLAYLISSGVPVVRSLEITSKVVGNSIFKKAAIDAAGEIQKGKQLREILSHHPKAFQPIVVQMIGVGEETGKVAEMLLRIASFFEDEVENTTKNISSIIEPVLIVVIGSAVGFFALAMLQPIYGSLNNIQ